MKATTFALVKLTSRIRKDTQCRDTKAPEVKSRILLEDEEEEDEDLNSIVPSNSHKCSHGTRDPAVCPILVEVTSIDAVGRNDSAIGGFCHGRIKRSRNECSICCMLWSYLAMDFAELPVSYTHSSIGSRDSGT
jgi:hypothetical protein